MKYIIGFAKRFVLGAFILYGYNLIAVAFNMIIPINLYSVGIMGLLGIPGLFALIFVKIMIF